MKSFKLYILLLVVGSSFYACKNDDELQINQAPGSVTVSISLNGNTALIEWSAAVDPNQDAITYDIILNGTVIGQNEMGLSYTVSDLPYNFSFNGQVIAKDPEGLMSANDFQFSTGPMLLQSYYQESETYQLNYDAMNQLTSIEFPISGTVDCEILFDSQGKLSKFGDMEYNYNTDGQINTIDNGEYLASLAYDSESNLTQMNYAFSTDINDVSISKTLVYSSQNKLTRLDFHYLISGVSEYYRYQLSYIGENVNQIIFQTSSDGINYATTFFIDYTYDSNSNPWYDVLTYQLGLKEVFVTKYRKLFPSSSFTIYQNFPIAWMSKNNLVQATLREPDLTILFQEKFTYTYNDNGYPDGYVRSALTPGSIAEETFGGYTYQ